MTNEEAIYQLGWLAATTNDPKDIEAIMMAREALAVEVVRCKDCKQHESDGGAFMICTLTDMIVDDDWFCWFGERREP